MGIQLVPPVIPNKNGLIETVGEESCELIAKAIPDHKCFEFVFCLLVLVRPFKPFFMLESRSYRKAIFLGGVGTDILLPGFVFDLINRIDPDQLPMKAFFSFDLIYIRKFLSIVFIVVNPILTLLLSQEFDVAIFIFLIIIYAAIGFVGALAIMLFFVLLAAPFHFLNEKINFFRILRFYPIQ